MYLLQLADLLEIQGVGKKAGDGVTYTETDFAIYVGAQGDRDNCITLIPTGGFETDLTFTGQGLESPTFQVLTRGDYLGTVWEKAYAAYKTLHGCNLFHLVKAMQAPEGIGKDENGRHEFSNNFKIIKTID